MNRTLYGVMYATEYATEHATEYPTEHVAENANQHANKWLLAGLLWVSLPGWAQTPAACTQAAAAFLQDANPRTLAALGREEDAACWRILSAAGASERLLQRVAAGDQEAARYLAAHLDRLDAGALENALGALGQFADRRMGLYLGLVRQGVLGEQQAIQALTTPPAGLSGNVPGQLKQLRARRQRLGLRAGTTHAPIQTDALPPGFSPRRGGFGCLPGGMACRGCRPHDGRRVACIVPADR